jgi:hypothetical protein
MYARRTLTAPHRVFTMTAGGCNRFPWDSPKAFKVLSQKDRLKEVITEGLAAQRVFKLRDIYDMCLDDFQKIWVNNQNMKSTIRSHLRTLREEKFIDFIGKGVYEMHIAGPPSLSNLPANPGQIPSEGSRGDDATDASERVADRSVRLSRPWAGTWKRRGSNPPPARASPPAMPTTHIIKDYEPNRCEARIIDKIGSTYQKNGRVFIPDNIRCGYMKREGCGNICLKHFNMTESYGKLWMGTVTSPRPDLELPENQPHHLKCQKFPYKWS